MMLRNYFKISLRNISKNKVFSFINIAGLSIGFACVLIILSYVKLELSYDKFHENSENIYRLAVDWEDDGQRVNMAMNHAPMAPIIREEVPGVLHSVRIYPNSVYLSTDQVNKSKEEKFAFADSTFFDVFTFTSIHGNLKTALDDPQSVVITAEAAIRHFGSTDVIGETLYAENERAAFALNVTAVIENFPQQSHFDLDFISAFSIMDQLMPWYNNWHHPPMYLYIETNGSHNQEQLQELLSTNIKSRLPEYVLAEKREYLLQPLSKIHLYSQLENEWEANSSATYVTLFVVIAGFILLIACVNFMNLATARSAYRAKEVGLRKVLGADRNQLIFQFLGEALITVILSVALAFALAELVLINLFNNVIEKHITIMYILQWPNIAYLIFGMLIISLLAGLYPAFYLSAYKPAKSLKGPIKSLKSGLNLRRGMVIFQFFISGLLIVGTLIVLQQNHFLRNKNLGFNKDHIVALRMVDRKSQVNYANLKQELLQESIVESVALSSTLPAVDNFYGFEAWPEGHEGKDFSLKTLGVDEDFMAVYDLKLHAGRWFDKDILSDQREAFILNEAAAQKLGWENPIGKEFGLTVYIEGDDKRQGKIIGVMEDFHFESLYKDVEPLVIYINKHKYYADYLSVRFKPGNIGESVKLLQNKWKAFNPDKPISFTFVDDQLRSQYKSETKRSELFTSFAILSIIVSCMGLFGLSAFSAQRRTKEVGVRKVLGASVYQIVRMLAREYVLLIVVANIIAMPIAWYFSQQWLANFAYRIEVSPVVFILSIVLTLAIALITISYQAIKAAMINPIETLKDE